MAEQLIGGTTVDIDALSRGVGDLSCGFILFKHVRGRPVFLLMRHHKGGHWGVPKGHPDPGESPKDAALRETFEECGLTPETVFDDFLEADEYNVRLGGALVRKRVVYFLGNVPDDAIAYLSFEHTEAVWLTPRYAQRRVSRNIGRILAKATRFLDENVRVR